MREGPYPAAGGSNLTKCAELQKSKTGVLGGKKKKEKVRIQKGMGFCVADEVNNTVLATEHAGYPTKVGVLGGGQARIG